MAFPLLPLDGDVNPSRVSGAVKFMSASSMSYTFSGYDYRLTPVSCMRDDNDIIQQGLTVISSCNAWNGCNVAESFLPGHFRIDRICPLNIREMGDSTISVYRARIRQECDWYQISRVLPFVW